MWHRGRCGAPWARLWCLCKSSRAADEARSSIGSAHPKGSIHSIHGRPDLCSVSSYCPVSWKRSKVRRNCVPAPSARKFGNIAADPISMSGGPASRSRGAPLILMLKRLQHLGSLRLVVRSLASCCALLGGLCCARWLLACSDAVGKIMALATLLWLVRNCRAIQYSRTEFRLEGRELNFLLLAIPLLHFLELSIRRK